MFFEISKISFLIRASPYASLFSNGSIGACSNEKDKESDYFAMGFRLYDPEIGRFLAIDPLLDIQPSQTPYHYCFNNPTSFTDPTGLYPKKEKGDKVQSLVKQLVRMKDSQAFVEQHLAAPRVNANSDEIDFLSALYRDRADRDFHEMIDRAYRCAGAGSGSAGGSSSGREGANESENGVNPENSNNESLDMKLNYKNADENLINNVNECMKFIKTLAELLNSVCNVVENLNDANVNVYFLSDNSEENEQYISEFYDFNLTEEWNKYPQNGYSKNWGNGNFDLCLSLQTFSDYNPAWTTFVFLDEIMHFAYDNMNIPGGVHGMNHHLEFYKSVFNELQNNRSTIFINEYYNTQIRGFIKTYFFESNFPK